MSSRFGRSFPIICVLTAVIAVFVLTLSLYRIALKRLYPIRYGSLIASEAYHRGVDPFLVAAVVRVESGFSPSVVSRAGAIGLMQIMPETGRWISEKIGLAFTDSILFEPEVNIEMGVWYLSDLKSEFGSNSRALAAYNAGRGRVREWLEKSVWSGSYSDVDRIPLLETRVYVRRVMSAYRWYRRIYREDWPT